MTQQTDYWQRYFPEFINSHDPEVGRLMRAAKLVKLPAGQQVFYPGGLCSSYLLMLEGCVKTQLISDNGREIVLYHVRSGETCVLTTSCLLAGDRYPAEGITEDNITAFVVPAEIFHNCLDQSVFFRQFVFKNFANRLSEIIRRMEGVVFGAIESRLSRSLLATREIIIAKTHQEISAELGTAREVVSRHLKRFEACGWVNLGRGTVEIVDRAALKQLTEKNSGH
jgi:CRP/FNR family transcriptional regulator